MDGTEIRLATSDDVEGLVALRAAFLAEVAGVDPADPQLLGALRAYFHNSLTTGQFVAYVAEYDGRIIATSGLVFHQYPPTPANLSGRAAYIMNMYTLPDSRGCGLATTLLQQLLDVAREQGYPRICLHAMPAGRGIYEKAGFKPVDTEMRLELGPIVSVTNSR